VAAAAGFIVEEPRRDLEGIDLRIEAPDLRGIVWYPKLGVQAKCTAIQPRNPRSIEFPLPRSNYDDLRATDVTDPRILIVMIVPERLDEWLLHSERSLAMSRCAYWLSLRGAAASANSETITVALDRRQQFTVEALTGIMKRLGEGKFP
jgi:hypothetical protein